MTKLFREMPKCLKRSNGTVLTSDVVVKVAT